MQTVVIRPEPTVFNDYNDEEFTHTATTDNSNSLKKVSAMHGISVYYTEKVIYPKEGGMLMKYKDVPYYRQGFVFPEATEGINSIKKILVLFLTILKGKKGRGLIKGRIEAGLAQFCWIADWMFQFYDPNSKKVRKIYLQENRYRQSVRELIKLINNFLENLGIEVSFPSTGKKDFGRVIGTLIEYDNAYHWRMEDVFSETSKEKLLKNPIKELKRLLKLYKAREKGGIEFKAEAIVKTLSILFWIPGIKKAFKKALQSIDVEKLKMTNGEKEGINDTYFTMNYEGYDFQGKTLEERQKIWLQMTDGKIPERVFIPTQN